METTEEAPVICLGKTFESEDARREYFRKELRKKLPELKQIDGFPIGDDDDIIELSDPPYYTACPNPWLNDFIGQWEEEKEQLLKHGKRSKKFSVDEPYASDISEGKYNEIYRSHSYHTKVPHPAIMRFILHYTQPGDIMFDGFAGTGMTGVAANLAENPDSELKLKIEKDWKKARNGSPQWGRRNAICGELSPIASYIAGSLNTPIKKEEFRNDIENIKKEMNEELGWMFETLHKGDIKGEINYVVWSEILICNTCGCEHSYLDLAYLEEEGKLLRTYKCPQCNSGISKRKADSAWETYYDRVLDESARRAKYKPFQINYFYEGSRYRKSPDEHDLEIISKLENMDVPCWVPLKKLPEGDKMNDPVNKGINYVHQFYSKRNLIALSFLWDRLNSQEKIIATSFLARNLTKKNRFVINKYNPTGRINGPLTGTLYIPSEVVEQSCMQLLDSKYFEPNWTDYNNLVFTGSATDVNIEDNSIDYIFTDPPFGSNYMYSELNFISESWLEVITNNEPEAIQNKTQNKALLNYQNLMTECFKEYHRILKSESWLTVEFSNTSASVWNSIQTALQQAGFVVSSVTSLDKVHGGIKSMTYSTAVKQDLVINCFKPSNKLEERVEAKNSKVAVWSFVDEYLGYLSPHLKKENSTTAIIERSPKILYDRLVSFYVTRGLPVPIDSKDFQAELKKRYAQRDGMYFTQEQVSEYDEKKAKTSEFIQLSLNVANENEGIEWLRAELQDNPQTYQDLQPKWMKAITAVRKGDLLPELQTILEQNYIKIEDGSWRVPNMNEAKDREAIRSKTLLREFEEYVDQVTGQGAKKLKEARSEALRAGFKNCWDSKDFKTIVQVGEKIPESLLLEDDQLLMYYDIATDRV